VIFRAYFAALGKLALLIAVMAFLTGVGLLVLGGFLSTWPIHRQTPRSAKVKAAVDTLETVLPALIRAARNMGGEASHTDTV
jgi:hypothetical protein